LNAFESSSKPFTIGPQHFDILKLIGEGGFGKVILVRNKLNDKVYAMKVISKKLLKKKNHIMYMKSEREILTKIHHPFIVSLKFAFQSEKRLFLVMDFLSGGELFFHLRRYRCIHIYILTTRLNCSMVIRRGLILEHEAQFYTAEMVLAIEFLHNNGIIHRDLKVNLETHTHINPLLSYHLLLFLVIIAYISLFLYIYLAGKCLVIRRRSYLSH
jgi:p70 ribosomal S6 kinase